MTTRLAVSLAFASLASLLWAGSAFADGAKPYTVTISKVAARVNERATARIVIVPAKGYHINKDFPTSLKLTALPGVTVEKLELGKADARLSEQEGSFEVGLTASQAGLKNIAGNLKFAVCSESSCDPQREAVTIAVEAK
jgi:hypothetical protein